MSAGVTCTLWANGERVADGSPGDDPADPTALSGLRLTWGRSDTVDQPDVSTVNVDLGDTPGGVAVRDMIGTGTTIDVTATGTTYPDPNVSTFPDPGFEAGPAHTNGLVSCTVARDLARHHTGAASTRLTPRPVTIAQPADPPFAATFAPLPFAAPGTDPGAWDAVPQTATGQRWSVGVWVWAPVGVTVTLAQVLFSAPYESAALLRGPIASAAGTGAWQHLTGTLTPAESGCWVGLQVAASWLPGWDTRPGTWDAQTGTWDDLGSVWVDDVAVLAPAAGTQRTVLVFSGRVTNLVDSWPDSSPFPLVTLTAADFTAELANRDIGDQPWVVESMAARVARIIALADPGLPVTIAPTVAAIPVSWRDVDSQPATSLLSELGTTVDAIMWAAAHQVSGPYLEYEDPGTRPPDQVLALVGGVVVIQPSTTGALPISACDLPRDAVRWTQDTSDVVSRAAITWQVQGVDEDGLPTTTESTYTLIDPARELDGTRRYGVQTQLTTQADAAAVAQRILGRTQLGWRASGLELDDATTAELDADQLLTLLDGTARNGLALALMDLPPWSPLASPVGLYLEGGTYEFRAGWWVLELATSSAHGSGQSATWNTLPAAWTWDQVDPAITWDDLTGVGVLT
jgi:hypothetical protein